LILPGVPSPAEAVANTATDPTSSTLANCRMGWTLSFDVAAKVTSIRSFAVFVGGLHP